MNRPAELARRDPPVGLGAGRLSDEAERRLARPKTAPLRPPPRHDTEAVARWRESIHELWLAGDPTAEECGHAEATIGGVRCLVAEGPGDHAPTIVYFHGGGFALGSPEVALAITDRLRAWANIVSVDYRLAPEHPFPAAFTDATEVLEALGMCRDDPRKTAPRLVLAGDSAGAGLATAACLQNPANVAALVLFSPQLDLTTTTHRRIDDPSSDVDQRTAEWLRIAYCDGRAPNDPQISPLHGKLAGLPPTLVQVGAIDSSLRQAIRFSRLAAVADASVTLDVWDGLWHTWHYHRELPEADRALEEAGRFAKRYGR
ncbi:MAG: alpha/beta hydrolase fold domain-containing protein [Acidimicrobiales bacterium]